MKTGPKGLTYEIAERIRRAYSIERLTQMEIASSYHVSQSLVSKIVNGYIHKPPISDIQLGGMAEVKVSYNYGN